MIKEIKYNGYSANPSDYECADGDLSVAMNLIPEDGVLKGIQKPQCLFTLPQGKKVIYIHNISVYKHYIIYDTESNALQWLSSNDTDKQPEDSIYLWRTLSGNITWKHINHTHIRGHNLCPLQVRNLRTHGK